MQETDIVTNDSRKANLIVQKAAHVTYRVCPIKKEKIIQHTLH